MHFKLPDTLRIMALAVLAVWLVNYAAKATKNPALNKVAGNL